MKMYFPIKAISSFKSIKYLSSSRISPITSIIISKHKSCRGYPLFVNGKIAGGIGIGGGTEEQDCEIAEFVVATFDKLTKK